MVVDPLRGGQGHGGGVPRAAEGLGHGLGHAHQVRLGEAVDVAVVGGLAVDHPQARARLAAALRRLHAAVVERQAEALAILRVQLAEVAAVDERAPQHALGQLGRNEAHGSSPSTMRTIRSDTASAVS